METYFALSTLSNMRQMQICLLAIGLLASSVALPQTPLGSKPPIAFMDIKPSVGECQRESGLTTPLPRPKNADIVPPDLSCAISPTELSVLIARPDTLIADVRPEPDYALFHLQGAINLTASALRTKNFLKIKTVVLIGSGLTERELYADCARLKANGFRQAKVLSGGLPAWLSSGRAVSGRLPDASKLGLLSPPELWAEARFNANLVLLTANRSDLMPEFPSAVAIPDASLGAIQAAINKRGRKTPLASVVLVTADDKVAAYLPNLRQAIQPIPLLAFTDSAEAYTRQLAQLQAVWDAQARGPKKPKCGS